VTVAAFPAPGLFPSEVLSAVRPALDALERSLPAGYRIGYGGEAEEQVKGFRQLAWALVLSVLLIGLALAIQFRSARKPLLVFATIPFGVAGAFVALRLANAPFGFMAFLGIASLIGVIVSHVIVLFDRIEVLEREGQALEPALVDAVRSRARPVLVTVAATVIALVPLARRGGPLWEPLCYAQMGGLTLATVVTFVLVPALYAVAVRDLRLIPWGLAGTPPRPRD
jgi:multidrug efflux pump subunit AcrB